MISFRNKHEGQRAFIIGTGPSLKQENLDLIRGELSFTCNRIAPIFKQTKWRPTYLLCITTRTRRKPYRDDVLIAIRDAEHSFLGNRIKDWMKPCLMSTAAQKKTTWITAQHIGWAIKGYYPVAWYTDIDNAKISVYGMSTFGCLQLAYYMGIKEVFLLGMDMGYMPHKAGTLDPNHFTPEYEHDYSIHPKFSGIHDIEHIRAYQVASRHLDIVNCTKDSPLQDMFPTYSLEEIA
jgi:hypothetical protein